MDRTDFRLINEAYFDGAQDSHFKSTLNAVKDELHDMLRNSRDKVGNATDDDVSRIISFQTLDSVLKRSFGTGALQVLDGMMNGSLKLGTEEEAPKIRGHNDPETGEWQGGDDEVRDGEW